jgi:hypothetical protein
MRWWKATGGRTTSSSRRNQRLLAEAGDLERKARRRGIVADDAALLAFYDRRIPADVTSARHFDAWWKKARAADPDLLTFSPADLLSPAAGEISPADYPGSWGEFPLSYEFAPGEPGDGVTVDIPLATLNQVTDTELGWPVPGLRQELVTELIRSLPKQLRTAFVPAPDTARAVLARLDPARGDLLSALASELGRIGGVSIPREAWDLSRLPAHLRFTYRVVQDGRELAAGKDLAALRRQLRPRLQAALTEAAGGITRTGLRSWDFGALPREFAQGQPARLPGAGRRRRRGRHPAVRDRGRGRRGDAARHPPPAADRRSVRRARRRQPAAGQRQAGDEPEPVPERRRAARRLRGLRGRPGDRGSGRTCLGRRGLRAPAGGSPVKAGRARGRRGRCRRAGARRGTRGRGRA